MNFELVERYNALVTDHDTVIHLGDTGMCADTKLTEIVRALRGYKILIAGNHDYRRERDFSRVHRRFTQMGFQEVHQELVRHFEDLGATHMRHVPVTLPHGGEGPQEFDTYLCGHVHEKWLKGGGVVNVGVDQWKFAPITTAQIAAVKEKRS